jgi:hypothetical protein
LTFLAINTWFLATWTFLQSDLDIVRRSGEPDFKKTELIFGRQITYKSYLSSQLSPQNACNSRLQDAQVVVFNLDMRNCSKFLFLFNFEAHYELLVLVNSEVEVSLLSNETLFYSEDKFLNALHIYPSTIISFQRHQISAVCAESHHLPISALFCTICHFPHFFALSTNFRTFLHYSSSHQLLHSFAQFLYENQRKNWKSKLESFGTVK